MQLLSAKGIVCNSQSRLKLRLVSERKYEGKNFVLLLDAVFLFFVDVCCNSCSYFSSKSNGERITYHVWTSPFCSGGTHSLCLLA